MDTILPFLRALGRRHTYALARNPEACFGFLWGLPIPAFSVLIDAALLGWHRPILAEHPWHLVFFAHPVLFSIVFGAMGTIRRDLERANRELIARLEREATTDPLTGVRNRRFVLEELDRAVSRAARDGTPLSVVMFDMDNFKAVNDTLGHQAGDKLLRDVAAGLAEALRQGDTVGRYGGDEFILVAPGPVEGAEAVAARAQELVRTRTGHTISAGAAATRPGIETAAPLIAAADGALAARKAARKAGAT